MCSLSYRSTKKNWLKNYCDLHGSGSDLTGVTENEETTDTDAEKLRTRWPYALMKMNKHVKLVYTPVI